MSFAFSRRYNAATGAFSHDASWTPFVNPANDDQSNENTAGTTVGAFTIAVAPGVPITLGVWYHDQSGFSTSAHHRVKDGTNVLFDRAVNQAQSTSAQATALGLPTISGDASATAEDGTPKVFLQLGTFTPAGARLTVEIQGDGSGSAIADTLFAGSAQAIPPSDPAMSWVVDPSGEAILGIARDVAGNALDITAIDAAHLPTFTADGVPVTPSNHLWGKTQPAYAPWVIFHFGVLGAPAPIPAGAAVAVTTSAGWLSTGAGDVAADAAVAVPWAVGTTLPSVDGRGPMQIWMNMPDPAGATASYPVRANLAKNIQFFSGQAADLVDSDGYPTKITGSFAAAPILGAPFSYNGNSPDLGFQVVPQAGTLTLAWTGPTFISGSTPLVELIFQGPDPAPSGGTTVSAGPVTTVGSTNTIVYAYSQDFTRFLSPTASGVIHGPIGDGSARVIDALGIHDGNSSSGQSWHPRAVAAFKALNVKGARWMTMINNSGFGGAGIVNPTDMTPATMLGDSMSTRAVGGTLASLGPTTDPGPGQSFDNAHCLFLLTFGAAHNLTTGQAITINLADGAGGPNSDGTFPVSGAGVTVGTLVGIHGVAGPVAVLSPTTCIMANTMNPPQAITPQATLSGTFTPGGGQTWTAGGQVLGGPPLESIAEHQAEVGKALGQWINLPIMGTDATIQAVADRLQGLPIGTQILLEIGNEHAYINGVGFYCNMMAGRQGLNDGDEFYVITSGHMRDVFVARWITHPGRLATDVKLVLGTATGATGVTTNLCNYATTHVPPIPFDYLATDPYPSNSTFGLGPDATGFESSFVSIYDGMTRPQLLCLYEQNLRFGGYFPNGIARHMDIVRGYPALASVKSVLYESGDNCLVPPGTTLALQARSDECTLDPRIYWAERYFNQGCSDAGVAIRCYFELSGNTEAGNNGIVWNLLYGYDQAPSRGDGSDGKYVNSTNYRDFSRVGSVIGAALRDWGSGGITVTASGQDFATLRAAGLRGLVAAVVAANAGLSAAQAAAIDAIARGEEPRPSPWLDLSVLLASYLRGDPVDPAAAAGHATDVATVYAALSEVAAEVAALVAANPGTLVTSARGVTGPAVQGRTFP